MLDKPQENKGEQPKETKPTRDFTPGRYEDRPSTPDQTESDVPKKAQNLLGIDSPPSGIIPDKAKERLGLKSSQTEVQLSQNPEDRRTVLDFKEHIQALQEQVTRPLSSEKPPVVSSAIKDSLEYATRAKSTYEKYSTNLSSSSSSDKDPKNAVEQARVMAKAKAILDKMDSEEPSEAARMEKIQKGIKENTHLNQETKDKVLQAIENVKDAHKLDTPENPLEENS